jgi:hypothetical protein
MLAMAMFLAPLMGGYLDVSSSAAHPGIMDLFGYPACTLAHALLYLLVMAGLAIAVIRKQVAQLPHVPIVTALGCLLVFITFSLGVSAYHEQSLLSFADWVMYAVAFLASCAIAGRQEGPKLLCGAFVAGCSLTALGGMLEYVTAPDPTWRIMYHWQDPNALAGVLVLGLFVAIGLGYSSSKGGAIFCLIGAGLIGTALLFTQSKGGLGGAMAAGLVLFIFVGAYVRSNMGVKLLYLFSPFVLSVVFFLGLAHIAKSTPPPASPAPAVAVPVPAAKSDPVPAAPEPLGRVLNPMSTAEQSAGFRLNLWKGCWFLIKANPLGYGIGTYRFESARPGNTTETKLAHNSFLQLAVEAGPLASLSFVAFLFLCAYEMLKSSRKLPEKQNMLRAGIFAAILAAVIHNCVDSDLYFAGTGLSLFMLLGIGLALSSDAIVPELLRQPARTLLLGVGALGTLIALYGGLLQIKIEGFLGDLAARSSDVPAEADSLNSFGAIDYRTWYYTTPVASTPDEALSRAQRSVDNGPTETGYHRLALVQAREGHTQEAIGTLDKSLANLDPNNLDTLKLKCDLQKEVAPEEAVKTAQQMISIEALPYFATRALPEIVPIETYQARLYLADRTSVRSSQIALLRPAIEGFENYSTTTIPWIVSQASVGEMLQGGPKEAVNVISGALNGTRKLAALYRLDKDENDAKWADDAERKFEAALVELDKPLSSSK